MNVTSTTKVLVTGADGFIGSHLTEMLLAKGCKVKALSQYNSFNNWGWLEGITHPNLEVVTGDVRDPHYVKLIMKDMGKLIIYNFTLKKCLSLIPPRSLYELE